MRKQSGPGVKTPGPPAFEPRLFLLFCPCRAARSLRPSRAMSKITGVWKRRLRPLLLTAVRHVDDLVGLKMFGAVK
jgi:hypothetical protein